MQCTALQSLSSITLANDHGESVHIVVRQVVQPGLSVHHVAVQSSAQPTNRSDKDEANQYKVPNSSREHVHNLKRISAGHHFGCAENGDCMAIGQYQIGVMYQLLSTGSQRESVGNEIHFLWEQICVSSSEPYYLVTLELTWVAK